MRRRDLVRHIERNGCHLEREGARHSIYRNPANGICAAVPGHREMKETTARTICDQLGIPRPD
ncbi:MAG: type II toxin-antitoxin system HicA family toxin [Thermoguttaceae bacterium]